MTSLHTARRLLCAGVIGLGLAPSAPWAQQAVAAGVQAPERGPVARGVQRVRSGGADQRLARVIVKLHGPAQNSRSLALAIPLGRQTVQHAQALGGRLGLALSDGRTLGAETQLIFAQGLSSQDLAQRLRADPAVAWAVPDQRRFISVAPTDPLYGAGQPVGVTPAVGQWYLRAPTVAEPAGIDVEAAWRQALPLLASRPAVVVAVLDSGVRLDHPDFSGKLLAGYDFVDQDYSGTGAPLGTFITAADNDGWDADPSDPGDGVTPAESASPGVLFGCTAGDSSWHGTQTTGIVGAATNNNVGIASVAATTQVLPVRVMGKCGGWDSDILAGMRWAGGLTVPGVAQNPHPARVINLSLGSPGACTDAQSTGPLYQAAVAELQAIGVVVIASAGNDSSVVNVPANCPGVIAVGGVRHTGTKAGYASLGPEVVVSAPGGNCVNATGTCLYPIVSTLNWGAQLPGANGYSDGDLMPALGTSFSAPQVAGTVALMLGVNPALDATQVAQVLRGSARAFPSSGADVGVVACTTPSATLTAQSECYCTASTCGGGLLDAGAAVRDALTLLSNQPLARIALLPSTLLVGQNIALEGAHSIAPVGTTIQAYQWQITAGQGKVQWLSPTTVSAPTLRILSTGSFTISLTVTDSNGAHHTATRSGEAVLAVVTTPLQHGRIVGMALDGLDLGLLLAVCVGMGMAWRGRRAATAGLERVTSRP